LDFFRPWFGFFSQEMSGNPAQVWQPASAGKRADMSELEAHHQSRRHKGFGGLTPQKVLQVLPS